MTEASLSTFNSEKMGCRNPFFLRQALFFIGFLTLLAVGTDRACGFFLGLNYDFKPSFVKAARPSAEILILGPSRAVHMLDPRVIEQKTHRSVYNLGINAGNLDDQMAMLRLYLKYNSRPRLICIEFTPEYLSKNDLQFHVFLFVNHLDNAEIFQTSRRYAPQLAWLRFVPLARYGLYNKYLLKRILKGALQFFRQGQQPQASFKGYEPLEDSWDGKYDDFLKEHPKGGTIEMDPVEIKNLEKLIELAKASSERVIFYEAPILAESLVWCRNREKTLQIVRTIFERHGVSYVNFQDLPLCQSRQWFVNSRHLNRFGTAIFSEAFSELLKQSSAIPS